MRASLVCRSPDRPGREGGVILVAVLLIVAIVAGLAVKYTGEYQLGLARAEARWHGAQARAFLEGTEEVAKLLFATADLDDKVDYLGEPWGNEVPIGDEGVTGVAKLVDASAQLNLNDLAGALDPNKPQGQAGRYTAAQRRFIRLLQTFPDLPLEQQQAESLLEAVVDWQDANNDESGLGGAELNYYQSRPDPYLPANAPFKSVEELRLVRGFDEMPELVNRLKPYITVVPGKLGLNVNTLEAQNPDQVTANNLLRSLGGADSLAPLSDNDALQLAVARPATGFSDTAALTDAWTKLFGGGALDSDGLKVMTDYFWLNATVQLVDQRRSTRTLMRRSDKSLVVVLREDMYELPQVVRSESDKRRAAN